MGQKGFTLVELLIVLAIMGLVIAFVPIVARETIPSLKLRDGAAELADAARAARALAIRENRDGLLILDLQGRHYRIGRTGRERRIADGFQLRLVTAAAERTGDRSGRIRFFSDGSSTGGRITLVAGDRATDLRVDWFDGGVTVEERDADDLP